MPQLVSLPFQRCQLVLEARDLAEQSRDGDGGARGGSMWRVRPPAGAGAYTAACRLNQSHLNTYTHLFRRQSSNARLRDSPR